MTLGTTHEVQIHTKAQWDVPALRPTYLPPTAGKVMVGDFAPSWSRTKDILKFSRLELLYATAHATILKWNHVDIQFEMRGLEFLLLRHIQVTTPLLLQGLHKTGKSTKLPLADFLVRGYYGKLGNGLTTLYARHTGILYMAHFEDASEAANIVRARHRTKTSKGKNNRRSPDFVTLDQNGHLGVLESKASNQIRASQDFIDEVLEENFKDQTDPFVGGTLTPTGASSGATIEHGDICGLDLHPTIGAQLHVLGTQLLHRTKNPGISTTAMLAASHFNPWWRLFTAEFFDVNQDFSGPSTYFLWTVEVAGVTFVTNASLNSTSFPFRTGSPLACFFHCGGTVMAIEKNIFMWLLQTLPDRFEPDLRDVQGPRNLHEAVTTYQSQFHLEVRAALGLENSSEGQAQGQGWDAAAAFQEGVIVLRFGMMSPRRFFEGQRAGFVVHLDAEGMPYRDQ